MPDLEGLSVPTEHPKLLFICGAVGSGNSFLFECLTEDPNVFGINEDGFGSMLQRIVDSENQMGRCPHAIDEFITFLDRLRSDRKTLILKTPANIYHVDLIRKYIPNSRFVCTLRSPYGAIVSGMVRHKASVRDTAQYWLDDAERIERMPQSTGIVTFEALVGNPVATLERFQRSYYQVHESALKYAATKLKADRQDPNRWEKLVNPEVAEEIRRCVNELELVRTYDRLAQRAITEREVISEAGKMQGWKGKLSNPSIMLRLAVRKIRSRLS